MGWRFRSRIGLGRWARLNFSKSGVSLGLGPRGANINIGPKGVRTTVGLPGTGISYQTFDSWGKASRSSDPVISPVQPSGFPWRLVLSVALATLLVLGGQSLHKPSRSTVSPYPSPEAAALPPAEAAVPARPALLDAESVREVQTLLKERGYDIGPLDGITGPLTRKAIHDYQWARSLPGPDEPTAALLARLRSERTHHP